MEQRWNDIDRGKQKASENNLSQCHAVHHNPTWTALGVNPGLHGENMATNRMSYGTATLKVIRKKILYFSN
jgi:hypothetical protein